MRRDGTGAPRWVWRLVGWALAAACLAPGAGPARAAEPLRSQQRPPSVEALLDDYFAAWNAHDVERVAGFLDEHVTYDDGNTPTPQKGRESARRNVIEALFKAVPDCVWRRVGPPLIAPSGVAIQWVRSGTNSGAWGDGAPATGRAFEIRGVTILRLRDYRILYQGDFYDPAGMRRTAARR